MDMRRGGAGWLMMALVGCGDAAPSTGGATGSASTTGEATQGATPTTGEDPGTAGVSVTAGGLTEGGVPTTGITGTSGITGTTGTTGTGITGESTGAGQTDATGTTEGDTTGRGETSSTAASMTDSAGTTGAGATDTTSAADSTGAVSGTTGADATDTTSAADSTGAVSGTTGAGGCTSPGDCPEAGECLLPSCVAGECGETPAPAGTVCALGQCDGVGGCVQCLTDLDCNSGVCTAGVCADATCNDGVTNGGESDVDCGGPCTGCEIGEGCGGPTDCASGVCTAGVCAPAGPLCAGQPADPITGQRCPLFMPCTVSSQCGDFKGCQQWFCNNSQRCELNALVGCWTEKGGACNADVVFTQQTAPPVDKRFVPPDNVDFRELASLAFTIKNNTASDLYLDKLPLTLEVMGGGSKFDVSSVKIFDNSGGTEHGGGDLLVCLTADPFSFPANGVMGPCAGSAFSKVAKGQSNQFIVNLAFAKEKTFLSGRSYRLRLAGTNGVVLKVGFNGPAFAGSTCGVSGDGFVGAWVTAQTP